MKNSLIMLFLVSLFSVSLSASKISKDACGKMGEDFIFAGGECIQYVVSEGEEEGSIIVVVHGTWDAGTNTLGRYAPFAESLAMATDITSIAVALPGYSKSSTNNFTSLAHKGVKNLGAKKEYVEFLGELVAGLKKRFNAETVTYVGHSAGAMMGATLTGIKPNLINNIALAGGRYDTHKEEKGEDLISMVDVMDKISKETNFIFIYGTEDKISKPEVTTSFYKIAKSKGLKATLVKVEGAPHIDLDMTDESVDAISELFGN